MIASKYNVPSTYLSVHEIKHRMWKHFVDTLNDFGKIIFFVGFSCVFNCVLCEYICGVNFYSYCLV